MDDKVYLWDLYDESAKKAFENKAISKNPFYDLSQIPSQKMRNEVRAFIQWRSTNVCPQSLYLDIKYHKRICRFFSECTSEKNSLKDRNVNAWIKKFKAWLFKEGVPIYEQVNRIIKRILLQEPNRPDGAGQSFGAADRHGRSPEEYS